MNKRELRLRATRNEQKNGDQVNIKKRKDQLERAEENKTVADRHLCPLRQLN